VKIFYNEAGEVIGSVMGASLEIEEAIKMPAAQEIKVPEDIATRIASTTDPLQALDLTVQNDEIIVPDANTSDTPAS